MSLPRNSPLRPLPDFAEFAEAFCAGFIACREGLTDDDGEAYMRGLMVAYRNSGRQKARRVIEVMRIAQESDPGLSS